MAELVEQTTDRSTFRWFLGRKPGREYLAFLLLVPPTIAFLAVTSFFLAGIDTGPTVELLRGSYPQRFLREMPSDGLVQGTYVVGIFSELATRYIWMASGLVFGACLFGVCFTTLWLIYRNFNAPLIWLVCAILLAISLPEIIEGRPCFAATWDLHKTCEDLLKPNVISSDNVSLSIVAVPLGHLDGAFRDFAVTVHIGLIRLLGFTMVMLAMAAAATLSARNSAKTHEAASLGEQIKHSQVFLYCSCVVLTASVVYSDAWGRWPVRLMPSGAQQDQLAAYQDQVTVAIGVGASVILLAAYVPLSLAHHWRAVRFARSQIGQDHTEKTGELSGQTPVDRFLLEHGLSSPLATQVQKIIALLLPALAGQLLALAPALAGAG